MTKVVTPKKGYVRVWTDALEALARADLSAAQHRVVLAVMRATWGWQRDDAALSIADLEGLTGLSRTATARALRGLIARGVLIQLEAPRVDGTRGVYSIADVDAWGRPVPDGDTGGVPDEDTGLYHEPAQGGTAKRHSKTPQVPVNKRRPPGRIDRKSIDRKDRTDDSLRSSSGAAVRGSFERKADLAQALMPLIRRHLYRDGKPPTGWSEAREVTLLWQLYRKLGGGSAAAETLEAWIVGADELRGAVDWIRKDTGLTGRIFYDAKSGVRPVTRLAEEAYRRKLDREAAAAARQDGGLAPLRLVVGGAR